MENVSAEDVPDEKVRDDLNVLIRDTRRFHLITISNKSVYTMLAAYLESRVIKQFLEDHNQNPPIRAIALQIVKSVLPIALRDANKKGLMIYLPAYSVIFWVANALITYKIKINSEIRALEDSQGDKAFIQSQLTKVRKCMGLDDRDIENETGGGEGFTESGSVGRRVDDWMHPGN